ncbi:MAG: hypothetical protein HY748_04080 [Elusimicrobia bacterium]|nr:hypothetical protein [Elusimicrobiota bacterium]
MFADKLAAGPGLPNRMAPNTAACFILSGAALALLSSDGPGRLAWSQALALPAAVISLTALVGYAYGAKRLYAVGSFIPMAANTAAAFFLLSLGTLLSRPGQGVARPCVSAGPGGVLLRLLAPSTLVIMVALGWLRLLGERAGLYGAEFGTALHVILCWLVIAWLLWRVASALDQTAEVRVRAEERVRSYAARLEAANKELESFSYSVSHDLRAPLRAVDGFSQILAEDCGDKLDDRGRDHLRRVREGCRRMAELIDGLLELSRVTRREMRREPVDLAALGRAVARQLSGSAPERNVEFIMPDKLPVRGDPTLLRAVLDNLIANAWKFTGNRQGARIELGVCAKNGVEACFVRDNGAGFDMAYADKLFGAFQRLHSTSEFPGWGVGLATVWRIVGRHGGRVWAEGSVGQGATFYFTLGGGHETE